MHSHHRGPQQPDICMREIKDIVANNSLNSDNNKMQFSAVSERELEVAELVKKGYSSRKIAECLKISLKTIEAHLYNVIRKLNLKNVAAVVNSFNNSQLIIHT
jgi:two-component system response regulator TtrR